MMIRVTVLSGPEANTSAEGAQRITIGSASYCNLRLTGRGIMAVHAEINATRQGLQLRSFTATGTRVNGQPVTEYFPSSGEEVEFGEGNRVRITAEENAPARAARPERAASRPAAAARAERPERPERSAAPAKDNRILGFPPMFVAAYVVILIGVFAFLAFGLPTGDVAEAYRQTQKEFTTQAGKAGLSEEAIRARWSQVERAYSLERTGHRDEAIAQYLRILAAEGPDSPRSALWRFATRRVAVLRSGGKRS